MNGKHDQPSGKEPVEMGSANDQSDVQEDITEPNHHPDQLDHGDPDAVESYVRQREVFSPATLAERHVGAAPVFLSELSPKERRALFWRFDRLGRVRLSQNFIMRQFLASEIALAYGLINLPDDATLAIQAGTRLCERVLEPIVALLGPIIIRSGFRRAALNAFGHTNGLMCASNEKNHARHIWDHPDKDGRIGASACILIPAFNAGKTELTTRQELGEFLHERTPADHITFFKRDNAFNIGWKEPQAPENEAKRSCP